MPFIHAARRAVLFPSLSSSLSSGFAEIGANFDGAADALIRGADLTGASNGTSLMFFASVAFDDAVNAANENLLHASASHIIRRLPADQTISVVLDGPTDVATTNTVGAERLHFLYTADTSGSGNIRVYMYTPTIGSWSEEINQAEGSSTIDHTQADWAISSNIIASAGWLDGTLYRVAYWQNISLPDITSASVRNNFVNPAIWKLVDPAISQAAYGTPIFDFWGVHFTTGANQGTGGDFAVQGSPSI